MQIGRALLPGQILDGATIALNADGDDLVVTWRNPDEQVTGKLSAIDSALRGAR